MAAPYVDVLAHVVLSSDTTTITISSIPSGYQDMYLIGNFRDPTKVRLHSHGHDVV